MNIDPIKLCCGKPMSEHKGVMCPDGQVMCCICFKRVPPQLLWRDPDDGQLTNVCMNCQANEAEATYKLVHRVHVRDEFDPDAVRESFELLHDPRCPMSDGEYICHERYEDTESGLDLYFIHTADPDTAGSFQERIPPGIYEVRAWSRKTSNMMDPDDWDGGLEILDEPRKPSPSVPLAESHQHWIWLAGARPPHWEIRGTGALL